MKKTRIKAILAIACSLLFQQCAFSPCTTLNIDLGGQNSSITGESDSWTNAYGLQGGISSNLLCGFAYPLSGQFEANISMQGARYEDDFGAGPVEGKTRLTYLNIPLLARYQLENGIYGEAGIQPGFLLSARDVFGGESFDYRDWVNPFDLGIPFGAGYAFNNSLSLGFRVIPGIININAGDDNVSRDRNFVVALRLSYALPLKSK